MKSFNIRWGLVRIGLVFINIFGIAAYPREQTNVDWRVGILIGLATALTLIAWINYGNRATVDLAKPFSWKTPLLPMPRYPIHFWAFAGISMISSGAVATVVDIIRRTNYIGFGGTFVFWGLGMFLAAMISLNIQRRRSPNY